MENHATDLLKTVPFVIIFSSADGTKAKTKIASSKDLRGEILDVQLLTLRGLCKLCGLLRFQQLYLIIAIYFFRPSKYHFCFHDDANEIPDTISLGSYALSMKEVRISYTFDEERQ